MTENFRRISLECAPRTELHDALGLTGCEVSVNALPAGAAVPFVHRHVKNEEVYGVLEGRGESTLTAKWSSSRRATGSASRPKAAAPSAPPPIRASASSASRRRRGASKDSPTTTASPATKRRPGSEPAQIHLRGRPCTHPFQAARADGLLRLPSVFLLPSSVRAGPIGNFPRTPFLSLSLSSGVSYSVDTRSGTRRGVAETRIKKPLRIVTC